MALRHAYRRVPVPGLRTRTRSRDRSPTARFYIYANSRVTSILAYGETLGKKPQVFSTITCYKIKLTGVWVN